MKDEIIREVWATKDAIAARHGYDIDRLVKHLRAIEAVSGCSVVKLHARRAAGFGGTTGARR